MDFCLDLRRFLGGGQDQSNGGYLRLTRQRLSPGSQLDDLIRDLFLSELLLALLKRHKSGSDVVSGRRHRHHPRLIFSLIGVHGGLTKPCIDVLGREPLEQLLRLQCR